MSKFIKYTAGLECFVGNRGIKLVKIEISQLKDGGIELQAVSGRNLSKISKYQGVISQSAYDEAPHDPYDETVEAIWALEQVGLTPAIMEPRP